MQPSSPSHDLEALRLAGIAALRAGDLPGARDLLAQAIRANPRDELAWLWLSGAVNTDDERRRCLERVLLLDPDNTAARHGLALLAAPPAMAPVPAAPTRAPETVAPTAPAPATRSTATPAPPDEPALMPQLLNAAKIKALE